MGASPDARRAVLLGAGLGLGLAGLEMVSSWGWWGGLAAIAAGLVPVALALALGGPVAAAVAPEMRRGMILPRSVMKRFSVSGFL